MPLTEFTTDSDFTRGVAVVSPNAPENPEIGRLWFDTTGAGLLKMWDGDSWESISGGDIIITDLTGSGTISGKTYFDSGGTSPSNAQLTAATSDNDDVTVAFTVFARGVNWQPTTVTASGAGSTPVISTNGSWSQVSSVRAFTGTVTLTDADTTGTITLTDSDGATATLTYTRSTVSNRGRTEQTLTWLSYSRAQTGQSGKARRTSWV